MSDMQAAMIRVCGHILLAVCLVCQAFASSQCKCSRLVSMCSDLFHDSLCGFIADSRFQSTGLERVGPLSTDIDNLTAEYSLQKPEPAADGPGNEYAK